MRGTHAHFLGLEAQTYRSCGVLQLPLAVGLGESANRGFWSLVLNCRYHPTRLELIVLACDFRRVFALNFIVRVNRDPSSKLGEHLLTASYASFRLGRIQMIWKRVVPKLAALSAVTQVGVNLLGGDKVVQVCRYFLPLLQNSSRVHPRAAMICLEERVRLFCDSTLPLLIHGVVLHPVSLRGRSCFFEFSALFISNLKQRLRPASNNNRRKRPAF